MGGTARSASRPAMAAAAVPVQFGIAVNGLRPRSSGGEDGPNRWETRAQQNAYPRGARRRDMALTLSRSDGGLVRMGD